MRYMIQEATPLSPPEGDNGTGTIDILIDDNRIAAMGSRLDPTALGAEKVIPAQDRLVIPGLVNAHLHSHDRFDKGRFDKQPLEVWMGLYNPPTATRDWTPRECYLRTMLGGIELVRSGTTTVIDDLHPGFPLSGDCLEAVFQAYQDLGLRALVSIAFADLPFYRSVPFLEEFLPSHLKPKSGLSPDMVREEVLDLWRDFAGRWQGRVRFILSPSGPQRCTEGFLKKVWDLSEELALPVVAHVLETKVQEFTGRHFYGKSIVEQMSDLGLLTPLTILAHCVWVNERDLELIAAAGCSVVHNPLSNLKLGSGIAPVRRIVEAGIEIGLGTDNHNASDTPNMFEAMKLAALIHRGPRPDYENWVGAGDVFRMATQGGTGAAHLGSTGTLEKGAKADLVLLDLGNHSFLPRNDLLNQLVFCETGSSVETVIIDGRLVLEKGRIRRVDQSALETELAELLDQIMDKIYQGAAQGRELAPYLRQAYERCLEAGRVGG